MAAPAKIIPVAAGKGGVGKTLLAANTAIALAEAGRRTVVVDLDLGGSNLHSHLGLGNRHAGLGDHIRRKGSELADLLVATDVPGLHFIPGDARSPFMANIAYQQKRRLLRQLRALDADYVVLDLGAGASYNNLDFFGLSSHGLLVTQAEFPAVMNMLSFLKQFLLRRVRQEIGGDHRLRKAFEAFEKRPAAEHDNEVSGLRAALEAAQSGFGDRVDALCADLRPRVVVNMADSAEDIDVSRQIDRAAANNLHLQLDYFGLVFFDATVRRAVRERVPLLRQYPDSLAARCIRQIGDRILKFWDRPIEDSAQRVRQRAEQLIAAG